MRTNRDYRPGDTEHDELRHEGGVAVVEAVMVTFRVLLLEAAKV